MVSYEFKEIIVFLFGFPSDLKEGFLFYRIFVFQ